MGLEQDLFLDDDLPLLKEDKSQTSQLDSAEFDKLVEEASKKLTGSTTDGEKFQIALSLPNHREPIVIRNIATITLGRSDKNRNATPTVDFNAENARALGVSRLHAKIIFENKRFFLKDMGSINGTWLNGQRLEAHEFVPLNVNDEICLGRLIMIVA